MQNFAFVLKSKRPQLPAVDLVPPLRLRQFALLLREHLFYARRPQVDIVFLVQILQLAVSVDSR